MYLSNEVFLVISLASDFVQYYGIPGESPDNKP